MFFGDELKVFTIFSPSKTERILYCHILNIKTKDSKKVELFATSVEKKQPAPASFSGDRVPQYLPGRPSGSAADVRAKGKWSDGRWTLELSRRLNTGHDDDTPLDTTRSYKMAVAAFNFTGDMDKASGVIVLSFSP